LARPKVEQHSIRIDPIMATFVVDGALRALSQDGIVTLSK
jgi:hypothetical protein